MFGLLLFFIGYPLLMFVMCLFFLVKPLQLGKLKWLLIFVYFAACFKDLITNIGGGSYIVAPSAPIELITWFSTLNVAMIISLTFAVFVHLGSFIYHLIHKNALAIKGKVFRVIYVLITIAAVSFAVMGHFNAQALPIIHTYTFYDSSYPKMPSGKFRIVQISDTHFGTSVDTETALEAMKLANAQNPDLILITGDLIDGKPEQAIKQAETYKILKAEYGVYGIHGNHEYYSYPQEWDKIWKDFGITMLNNEHVTISVAGKNAITIAGVNDRQGAKVNNATYEAPNIDKALENSTPGIPVILMSHRPDIFDEAASKGIDLTLSGHTHGGMLIGVNKLVEFANKGYVAGYYHKGNSKLIVDSGTFLWGGFFTRLGTPKGEIVVIDLVNRDK